MVLTQHPVETNTPTYGYADLDGFLRRMTGDEKHTAAATSTLDVLWTLYDRVLRVDPDHPDHPHRDRFYLSKGHGPAAFYAVLAAKGFIDPDLLDDFAGFDSPLGHHPDRSLVPGVEISSGSLGQGLALGIGAAKAIDLGSGSGRVVVLMGDGEMDEGSVHEAIAVAGRLSVSRLIAIVIDNASATHGWPGGIAARFATEGWDTTQIDGRDHDAIEAAMAIRHPHAPLAIIAIVEARNG